MQIKLSGAALTASLLLATAAWASETATTQGATKLAQADDAPMVITPHPQNGPQVRPPARFGWAGRPLRTRPQRIGAATRR